MRVKNRKKLIIVVSAGLVAGFIFYAGMVVSSLWYPVVVRHELSEIQAMERALGDEPGKEEILRVVEESYAVADRYKDRSYDFWQELVAVGAAEDETYRAESHHSLALRGFMQDLERNHLMLHYDLLSGPLVIPDLSYYLEEYQGVLDPETIEYLEFRILETEEHLFNRNINTVDMEKIVSRIEWLEGRMNENRDSLFAPVYRELLHYYYESFEGRSHDFFVDADTYELTAYAKAGYEMYKERPDRVGDIARQVLEEGPWQQSFLGQEEGAGNATVQDSISMYVE